MTSLSFAYHQYLFLITDTGYRSILGSYNKTYMKFSVNHRRESNSTTETFYYFHSH